MAQIQRRAANAAPLGPTATGVLNMAAQEPVHPKAVAAALDLPAQSITRAVSDLVESGLVRRVEDTSDGRSYLIDVTEAGIRERDSFREELLGRFSRLLSGWSDAEVADFAAKLAGLTTGIAEDLPDVSTRGGRNPWRAQ
ncbi:MAG: MarR family transcriptional regulator [Pseudonocardia sp.]|nr:MarR family transcriptional regulator [Pseudonocardia sp.]